MAKNYTLETKDGLLIGRFRKEKIKLFNVKKVGKKYVLQEELKIKVGGPDQCLVCDGSAKLTKHHVIPQFLIEHFPHNFVFEQTDIVILCEQCHCTYEEEYANKFNDYLIQHIGLTKHNFKKRVMNSEVYVVLSKINALKKYSESIPEEYKNKIKEFILTYFGGKEPTLADIKLLKKKLVVKNDNYTPFTKILVDKLGLSFDDICRQRRLHFCVSMEMNR